MSIYSPFLIYQRILKTKLTPEIGEKSCLQYIYLLENSHLEYINNPLEREMATHSIILAWRRSWTEEFGRRESLGLQSDTAE